MGFFSQRHSFCSMHPVGFSSLVMGFLSLFCFTAQISRADDQPAQPEAGVGTLPTASKLPLSNLHPNAFDKPYGYHLAPILEHIHADSDQRDKITAIVSSYRSKIEPLRIVYKQKSQDFLVAVTKGLASDLIISQQMQLGQIYSDINSQYCLMSLAIRRLLKPDQIVLYEEYRHAQGWSHK